MSKNKLPLQQNIIRVYRTDRHGRQIYSLENKFGTFKRAEKEMGRLTLVPTPLAKDLKGWVEKLEDKQ